MKSSVAVLLGVLFLVGCGGGGGGGGPVSGPDMSASGCPADVTCVDACVEVTQPFASEGTNVTELCQATCDEGDPEFLQSTCDLLNELRADGTPAQTEQDESPAQDETGSTTTQEGCNDPDFDCVQGCKDINIECFAQPDDQDLADICELQCQDEDFSALTCSYINNPAGICAME